MNVSNKKEFYWNTAISISDNAINKGSLIPLKTRLLLDTYSKNSDFEIRSLISKFPNKTFKSNPIINPFSPWDPLLEVSKIDEGHVLILNKYPVELGHLLLITSNYMPQNHWLSYRDFKAINEVEKDTIGLWFFNSSQIAGASQPHRHIQLLRRNTDSYCPRNNWFIDNISSSNKDSTNIKRNYNVFLRDSNQEQSMNLYTLYKKLSIESGIGNPLMDIKPLKPYNLLITPKWFALIPRVRESYKGFNINALGFAGYLLATQSSDIDWLKKYGSEKLLEKVSYINNN